jgi:hypothetical protein
MSDWPQSPVHGWFERRALQEDHEVGIKQLKVAGNFEVA